MQHKDLTIVAIYGHNDGSSAIPALWRSKTQLKGSRALLVSQKKPDCLPDNIGWKPCFAMDYNQYSIFCMYSLPYYVETDYCLIVQDDGWVLNGANFTAQHYEYDYIGPPAHAALVGTQLHMNFMWVDKPNPIIVQNGGFSLRSRKFMEAPGKYGLAYAPFLPMPLPNEDVQLTALRRKELEQVGIKFAPLEVAMQFAVEYMGPGVHDKVDFEGLVGHHGRSRKLFSYRTIKSDWTKAHTDEYFRETEFMHFLSKKGYSIKYAKEARK